MQRFAGKVALVTGAGSGIGRATAIRLAAEGAKVLATDVNAEGLKETVVQAGSGTVATQLCDVSDVSSVRKSVEAVTAQFGGLDVLCNAAGIGSFQNTAEVSVEDWARVIGINLTGTFYMSQAALPHLLVRRGVIVNLGSTASLIGQAYSAAYCASKGGVLQLTKAMAVEFARQGLRVNCLCPGGVATPLAAGFRPPAGADIDLIKRLALVGDKCAPAEIAAAVAYLASDEARYINGAVLSIDGGVVAS